ncbi:hypothetical protein BDZ94DRAFT_817050 [Collybia nuda]|uniref:Uncharacterized protein n=1 Tax=Collybia nuda TaxID=64659 RepID=A0A9P5Y4D6_9AGAR|nr:hypothetical protein BDZ94DRAFT_817050 [Collybia nuda]
MSFRNTWFIALLSILTLISTTFNAAVWLEVVDSSHRFLTFQKHDFQYDAVSGTPREVPGSFRGASMVVQSPDDTYPLTNDEIWASIVPPQRGFIRLGPQGTPFAISLYHQLHCINGIRFAYVAARDSLFKRPADREAAFQHVNHCFDVLRHSLLCKADTTLSPVGSYNQTNITRRCRDWAQVREFVDKNHEFWRGIPYASTETNTSASTYHE